MEKGRISVDEWLAELVQIDEEMPEGFTTRELKTALGISIHKAGFVMREWYERGLIERSGTRKTVAMDGKPFGVPVYQPTAKATKNKKAAKKRGKRVRRA